MYFLLQLLTDSRKLGGGGKLLRLVLYSLDLILGTLLIRLSSNCMFYSLPSLLFPEHLTGKKILMNFLSTLRVLLIFITFQGTSKYFLLLFEKLV